MLILSCLVKQYIYRFKGTGQSKIKSVSQHLSATLLNCSCSPSSTTSINKFGLFGPINTDYNYSSKSGQQPGTVQMDHLRQKEQRILFQLKTSKRCK